MQLMRGKPIISLDFDGVVHQYITRLRNSNIIPDPPIEGIKEVIDELNISSEYFKNLCYKSKSDDGTDIILSDRKKDYLKIYNKGKKELNKKLSEITKKYLNSIILLDNYLVVPIFFCNFALQQFEGNLKGAEMLVNLESTFARGSGHRR